MSNSQRPSNPNAARLPHSQRSSQLVAVLVGIAIVAAAVVWIAVKTSLWPMTTAAPKGTWGLAWLLAVSGVLHFVKPRPYERMVPHSLPAKRGLVYLSGAAELACAAGLAHPRTRRYAGLVSAGLLLAVYPANFQVAADVNRKGSTKLKTLAFARLPLQLPMIRTAWRTWKS